MKYVLLFMLALALGLLASGRHRARARHRAPAAPVVVRKSAWAAGRPKTVRAVPPGPQP
ncbi:MAG: hypothetical protein ACRYFR_17405 [Janthinobacterium lividum]